MSASNNDEEKIEGELSSPKRLNYWETTPDTSVYPKLEQPTFTGFIKKIGMGLILTFIPALVFTLITSGIFLETWGIAIFLVSGIYFVAGGCSDLSQTSAKKSFKRHMEETEHIKSSNRKYQFDLRFFQFGKGIEDVAAAISLLALGVLVSTLAG
ncbi:MAG: hypothetical protein JSV04_06650 [Candidatus Heimdallarchaeota archaeon]|nr:MAG: hypothetical protein JSV04_06650 [Candidatus Heimdallarchaeota archaeon]